MRHLIWVAGFLIIVVSVVIGGIIGGVVGFTMATNRTSTEVTSATVVTSQNSQAGLDSTSASASNPQRLIIEDNTAIVEAVSRALPAVVTVEADSGFGGGSGSGFFISTDGYIVTNNHVVEAGQQLSIIYATGGQVPATLVGAAPEFDLAVLKVDGPVPAILEWGDSGDLPLGASVVAIGSALGEYRNTVTAGILSGVNRQLGPMAGLLQTDTAVNEGNSGGPLIDMSGRVVGINTLVVRGERADAEGLGFAIPSSTARSVVQTLIETGSARHPFLGIQYQALNPQLANQARLSITEGALLQSVMPGTPAEQAGLQPGDVIVALNGQQVNDRRSLVSLLLEHVAGETVTLDIMRNGEQFQTQLTLGERA